VRDETTVAPEAAARTPEKPQPVRRVSHARLGQSKLSRPADRLKQLRAVSSAPMRDYSTETGEDESGEDETGSLPGSRVRPN